MQGSDRPSFSFPELRSVCGSASAIHTDQDPSAGNENDRPYVCLPDFLDTGLPRGNVNERDSGPMRGACHPYPTSQPVKVGHTTGGIKSLLSSNSYAGSFTSRKKKWLKVLWDRTYGFSSLSEKTMKSNHLQMSLQRHLFLLFSMKWSDRLMIGGQFKILSIINQRVPLGPFLQEIKKRYYKKSVWI